MMSVIILMRFSLVVAINYRCLTSCIVSLYCPTNASTAVNQSRNGNSRSFVTTLKRREKRGIEAATCNKTRTWTAMCRSKHRKTNEFAVCAKYCRKDTSSTTIVGWKLNERNGKNACDPGIFTEINIFLFDISEFLNISNEWFIYLPSEK